MVGAVQAKALGWEAEWYPYMKQVSRVLTLEEALFEAPDEAREDQAMNTGESFLFKAMKGTECNPGQNF